MMTIYGRQRRVWIGVSCFLWIIGGSPWAVAQQSLIPLGDEDVVNPYYAQREWSVWTVDEVGEVSLPEDFALPPSANRQFPDGQSFLSGSPQQSQYAGWWDDVYVSQDNFHSSLPSQWSDEFGRSLTLRGQLPMLKRGYFQFEIRNGQLISPATTELKRLGANFTSQSTNGMGHEIVNTPLQMLVQEREFYFANILRSGPAHVSYQELSPTATDDQYQALTPCLFNSIGSSGSETWGLAKMVIAGGYLDPTLKEYLKLHGVYPATLLYLWKAGLPYDVPYAHELRHRVAYFADGEDRQRRGRLQADVEWLSHSYDDTLHLQNMVQLASALETAPPMALLGDVQAKGGKLMYGLRSTALVVQDSEDVTVTFSTRDSYDISGLPVTVELVQLYGNPATKLEKLGDHEYRIHVPFDAILPRGRTAVAVIPRTTQGVGNPAIVNVFRSEGQVNQRPIMQDLPRSVVAPGRTIRVPLVANDPEGFPVRFAKRSDQPGRIEDQTFVWSCPADWPTREQRITIIASDGTSGSSYASFELPVLVTRVVSNIEADKLSGELPLTVGFSPLGSGDVSGQPLKYDWDFGDGTHSTEATPTHRFEKPGLFEVGLAVTGPSGSDTARQVIHARHNWPMLVDDGWVYQEVDDRVWRSSGADIAASVSGFDGGRAMQIIVKQRSHDRKAIELQRDLPVPCYVECEFQRGNRVAGVGIEVFGAVFGRGQESLTTLRFADDFSFTPAVGDPRQSTLILPFPIRAEIATLRMYVQAAEEPGQVDFSGYVDYAGKSHYFSFADQPVVGSKLAILGGELGAQFVSRFQVWAPAESSE